MARCTADLPMATESATREADVVVVGCGMAGLAAALAAADAGVDVIVLEKAPEARRGGHTRYTESFRIPTADVHLDATFDVPDYTAADFYADLMAVTNFRADTELATVLTQRAADTFEWLTAHGLEWETEPPHSGYTAGRVWIDGAAMVDHFVDRIEMESATVVYDAAMRELTRDDTGAVDGVLARVGGVRTACRADAVVLAAGDYGSSAERRTRYYGPGYGEMPVRGSRYNTGEAIEATMAAGAKSDGAWGDAHMAIIDAASPPVEGGITRIDGYQYGLMLNHEGERFVDEGADSRAHTYAKFGREIFEQPYREAFIVVDATTVDDVAHMGPGDPVTGDSIRDLARRLDIDRVDRAVETIETFNAACDPAAVDRYDPNTLDGNATEGLEPPKSNWALPLTEPPFTGYPVTGGMTFGFGGVAITPDAAVLDTRDEPIPGLFAAGNATGGLFYENYPGGTGLTNAAVFGRIAGENAARDALE